jgi:hypothetical protein
MPISAIDGCPESHWSDIQEILTDAIQDAGFEANLVSSALDVGIIHKRIIQNLYDNPIVVCDVSGKNPNVMFELGLRLAFDKPTIIVKDDKTTYSFDTSPIEHLEYPRDLRFARILEFKEKLIEKIKATHEKATTDSQYATFLKHYGTFTVARSDKKEVTGQEFLLEEMKALRNAVERLAPRQDQMRWSQPSFSELGDRGVIDLCLKNKNSSEVTNIANRFNMIKGVGRLRLKQKGDHRHLHAYISPFINMEEMEEVTQAVQAVGITVCE